MQTAITVFRHMPPVTLAWNAREENLMFSIDMAELSRGAPQGLFTGKAQTSPRFAEHLCAALQANTGSSGVCLVNSTTESHFHWCSVVRCLAVVFSQKCIMIHRKPYFKIKSCLYQNIVTELCFYFFMFSFIVVFWHVLSCPPFLRLSVPTPFSFLFSVLQSWATLTLNCVNNKLNFIIFMF